MSASKTNFLQGIALILKEMWKTCTSLSKKVVNLEETQVKHTERLLKIEQTNEIMVKQHLDMIEQIKSISLLQADIAKQIVNQHEETDQLYKALGLKKDLSYYSFNLHQEEGH